MENTPVEHVVLSLYASKREKCLHDYQIVEGNCVQVQSYSDIILNG